jgi:hypothetical protein
MNLVDDCEWNMVERDGSDPTIRRLGGVPFATNEFLEMKYLFGTICILYTFDESTPDLGVVYLIDDNTHADSMCGLHIPATALFRFPA